MKKLYTLLLFVFIIVAAVTEQGCDILSNLFLNLPVKQTLDYEGSDAQVYISKYFCLSEYSEFNDNIDNIEGIKYVGVLYSTDSSSSGLRGSSIAVRLLEGDGVKEIWSVTLPSANAEDYIKNPLELELTPTQVNDFNDYLANYQTNDCFVAELYVKDVTDDNGAPFYIRGRVEFVVELEIKP